MQPDNSLLQRDSSIPRWKQLLTESGLLEQIGNSFPSGPNVSVGTPSSKNTVIEKGLACLSELGQVVELRILGINGKKRTDRGYFDNVEKLAKAAASYDGRVEGIYFTLNPVNPALMARANNRVKQYAEHTTSDNDILKRINLPIDFDPIRPTGISSTDEEQQAALMRAWACRLWLSAQGWPEPVFASSGNGAHLIYAIDLPNDSESTELIKGCLTALSSLFSDSSVKLDTSTGNASRIFKLYGTLACKGDPTPERPHRRAAILAVPENRQMVSHEQLSALAAQAPLPKSQTPQSHFTFSNSPLTAYGRAALDREIAILAATTDGNRNNQLFQSTAALFSLVASHALDRDEVWNALLSTGLSIGLSESEARRTIGSGEKRGSCQPRLVPPRPSSRGSETPNPQPSDGAQNLSKPATAPTVQHLMHADELDNLPPIQWLIQDILPANNLVEVHGAPGAGKTQVVFDMAQTLAATGQTVIYVVAEGLQGYRGRKRAWQKFHKLGSGSLFIWNRAVHLFDAASVQSFLQVIYSKKPTLIVFDTLSRCSLGADENSQKDMNFILDALDRVRRETGSAIVAVHHTNAAGARERGSTVIRGGMDVMLEVSKDDELITVSCSKMKDAADFESLYLKPVLVDIGEEKLVPVLVPAEKRVQTQADKLTPLQLDTLKAIGMEMFAESGIKSSQLDEILPPTTKRATKYYSLNTLIRLGYVKPHAKGDPYFITEDGRQKLSSTENRATSNKSNESKASPSLFIWKLPEPCPMSSPVPHSREWGTDETLDCRKEMHNVAGLTPPVATESPQRAAQISAETLTDTDSVVRKSNEENSPPTTVPMTGEQLAQYAKRAGVTYPTTKGADLYHMGTLIPKSRRDSFENGLGDAVGAYYEEISRQGHEPPEPAPDPVESFVRSGLVSAEELFAGYERAQDAGQATQFLAGLKERNDKAAGILRAWIDGGRGNVTAYVPRSG